MLILRADLIFLALMLPLVTAFAQTESTKSSSSQSTHHKLTAPAIAEGISGGIYRNPSFGFTYKIPFGWVDRTQDMQQGEDGPSKVWLSIFQRPPEARGEDVNSAVVIVSESVSSYRGLKTAADHFGPLQELTIAKGFKVSHEPYTFSLGTKTLVRGDFSKPRGTLTMFQSSLVMLEKKTVVSFTFIGGSEEEVNELIESLSFGRERRTQ